MINVIFMGTPDIAVDSLNILNECPEINIKAVITQPDRPKGRGNKLTPPPVKVCANENNILCFQTAKISNDEELIKKLKELKPDFFVTFAFGQILSQEVLNIPKYSTVNLHASLLPKYRGANPIQRCIFNGDKKTGITTMLTVLELDAGDICETKEINISDNMTDIELRNIIKKESGNIIISTLKGLINNTIKPKKQDKKNISVASKFTKQDGLIDWNNSAINIHNQVRAMVSFPNAFTYVNNKMIKILETKIGSFPSNPENYSEIIKITKEGIEVGAKEGSIIITKVKPENKGIMGAYDFANGAKIHPGMKFGDKICIKEV